MTEGVLPATGRRLLAAVGLLLAAAGAGGCGYTPGYRTPDSVSTIAVPIFDNQTFPLRREVEYDLTSAFRRQIQSRTALSLVDHGDADMVVHGTIVDFRERVVAEGRRDEKIESSVFLDVLLIVEDRRNNRRWEERVRVQEPLSYIGGEGFDEARARAIENMAQRMLEAIEFWGDEEGPAAPVGWLPNPSPEGAFRKTERYDGPSKQVALTR
jgi:hypothetical protein